MFVDCDLLILFELYLKFVSVLVEIIIVYSRFYYDCDIILGMINFVVKIFL